MDEEVLFSINFRNQFSLGTDRGMGTFSSSFIPFHQVTSVPSCEVYNFIQNVSKFFFTVFVKFFNFNKLYRTFYVQIMCSKIEI